MLSACEKYSIVNTFSIWETSEDKGRKAHISNTQEFFDEVESIHNIE